MIILIGLAALGIFAMAANLTVALGNVLAALIKYVVFPLLMLFCIAYIAKYGLC